MNHKTEAHELASGLSDKGLGKIVRSLTMLLLELQTVVEERRAAAEQERSGDREPTQRCRRRRGPDWRGRP